MRIPYRPGVIDRATQVLSIPADIADANTLESHKRQIFNALRLASIPE